MGLGIRHDNYRNWVIGADATVPLSNGTYVIGVNFDNAATTPPFISVMEEINRFAAWYSSIHRGKGYKSMLSSEIYENGRSIIQSFVGADADRDTVIYTKNTTDAINLLAHTLGQQKDGKDIVLSTWMEHAANDLPWRDTFHVEYVEIDALGRLSMEDLEAKLMKHAGRVKLVTVTGASNVTGYINPVHSIAALAHTYGTRVLVDGAQWVPHARVDMKPFGSPEHLDFLVFSAHKMYAPFGAGVLIGPKDAFTPGQPYCRGGSAIKLVTHKRIDWEEPPQKDEAGTPNLMGVVALLAAVKTLQSIGMEQVFGREKELLDYAVHRMKKIPGIHIYNHPDVQDTISMIPFNMEGVHHSLMSAILSHEAGIAVRNGFFCSHPYCERLLGYSEEDMEYFFQNPKALRPGMVRVSFGLYNDYYEIDRLIYALHTIGRNKTFYLNTYANSREQYGITNDV